MQITCGQELGTLPSLRAVLRCNVHATIRSMENAIEADPQMAELIELWVNGFPAKDSLGGFSRAVRNSKRLAHRLQDKLGELEAIDHCAQSLSSWHFAPQRFNTMVENCEKILIHLPVVFEVLQECAAARDKNSAWAHKILQTCFHPRRLIQLAMLAEFCSAATAGAHEFDGKAAGSEKASRLAKASEGVDQLELRLNQLFSFRSMDGELQQPLTLNPAYSTGFVQMLQRSFDLKEPKAICANGSLLFFSPGHQTPEQLKELVAKELGAFQNVTELFLKGCKAEVDDTVGAALAPFNFSSWPKARSDAALCGSQGNMCTSAASNRWHGLMVCLSSRVLKPLAQVLDIPAGASECLSHGSHN